MSVAADLAAAWQTLAANRAASGLGITGFEGTIGAVDPVDHGGVPAAALPRLRVSGRRESEPVSAAANADFEIVRLLGEGGMGRVHLARQRALDREVALKTLHDGTAGSPHAHRLAAEAVVMGSVEHPNVAPIHRVGVDAGGPAA